MKGKNTEEIDNANYAIEFLGGKISDKKEFSLPNNVGERTLVKVEKVSDTPNGYPRVYDKIHKYPIAGTGSSIGRRLVLLQCDGKNKK